MTIETTDERIWPGPLSAMWMLTNRCNLSCQFCMVESEPNPKVLTEELSREEQLAVARQMIEHHIMRVTLTGGEPTLLPHLEEIVAVLAEGGAYVYLTTNGMLLTRERVEHLVRAGLHEGQVSLNGATAEINDALMGRHAHHHILRGLSWMKEAGLRTQVKVTVTRANQHEMIPLIDRLLTFGVNRINLSEVGPSGRAGVNANWIQLKPDEAALRALQTAVEGYGDRRLVQFSSLSLTLKEMGRSGLCSLGTEGQETVIVLPSGDMTPCNSVWHMGIENNVLRHGWLGAYHRLPGLYGRYLLEELLAPECLECEQYGSCLGGCRGLVHRTYGRLRVPDPLCPLLNQVDGLAVLRREEQVVIPVRAVVDQPSQQEKEHE